MALIHPKKQKACVICKRWQGDAGLKFKNPTHGFEYDATANGKCLKKNSMYKAGYTANQCRDFEFSVEADRLL
jgi:hypothetical protein